MPLDDDTSDDASKGGITCPGCGKFFDDEDLKFCDNCGESLSGGPSQPDDDDDDISSPVSVVSLSPSSDDLSSALVSPDPPQTPSPSTVSWKLKVVEGMVVGKEYALYKDEILIGRTDEEDNIFPDIDLEGQDDGFVSRRHAILRIKGEEVTVEDMGGTNGTMVENRPIQSNMEISVSPGQVIRTGKVGMMLQRD